MKSKAPGKASQTGKRKRKKDDKTFFQLDGETLPGNGGFTLERSEPLSIFAVGHRPGHHLSPHDAALFRAFQSNLLSLISHELRTPLIGILNALSVLAEGDREPSAGMSDSELLRMANGNARRLHQALGELLDLAELDSGTFHVRLREVELVRLVRSQLEAYARRFSDRKIRVLEEILAQEVPILGDPQKLGRALEICFDLVLDKGVKDHAAAVNLRISSSALEVSFDLPQEGISAWDTAWSHGVAGFQGGVASPASVFGGVLRTEQEFLSRSEEGLGGEFTLIHEIMRLHQGKFEAERMGTRVRLFFEWVPLASEESLNAVLVSRAAGISRGLGMVTLVLIQVPSDTTVEDFRKNVKAKLFRSSDGVYALPLAGQVALVLDDTRAEDTPGLVRRIEKALELSLKVSFAHCPDEVLDPGKLLELASKRMVRK